MRVRERVRDKVRTQERDKKMSQIELNRKWERRQSKRKEPPILIINS